MRNICGVWTLSLLVATAAWGQIAGFETNTYEVFSMPSNSFPSAINTAGTILASGLGSGFLVRNGAIAPFVVPAADLGLVFPNGLGENGDVVGEYRDSSNNAIAFAAIGGKFELLTEPGGRTLFPQDINLNKTIVGSASYPNQIQVGFIRSGGNYSFVSCTNGNGQPEGAVFSGINRHGAIAGWCLGPQLRGFVFQNGSFTFVQYPGSEDTRIFDINSDGDLVGDASVTDSLGSKRIAFLYRKGTFYDVSFPGTRQGLIRSINDHGELLGSATIIHRGSDGTFLGFHQFHFVRGTRNLK